MCIRDRAYVNDKEAEVEWAGTFEETGEGTVYYVMVDISRSISDCLLYTSYQEY